MDFSRIAPEYSGLLNKAADVMPFSSKSVWKFADQSPIQSTMYPTVTGCSVFGIKYNEGVIICADVLGSYGRLARFSCERLIAVNDRIILGAGGDYADFQYLTDVIKRHIIDEDCLADGFIMKPKELHSLLTRVLYNRRSNMNPLWNTYVVAGMENDVPFLGQIGMIGTAFQAPTIATGLGSHLAQPILRTAYEANPNLNEKEARNLIIECARVLFYRDTAAFPKYQIGIINKDGARVEEPISVDHFWPSTLNGN